MRVGGWVWMGFLFWRVDVMATTCYKLKLHRQKAGNDRGVANPMG